jgi:putative membrane protein
MKMLFVASLLSLSSLINYAHADSPDGPTGSVDIQWMKETAQNDMAEISMGKLAQVKSSFSSVKNFGAILVTDHTKHLGQLMALATAKGVTLPSSPTPDQMIVLNYFTNSKSSDWSYDFTKYEVYDHKHGISSTQKEISMGTDPDVVKNAEMTLPVLQMHLEMAETISSSME